VINTRIHRKLVSHNNFARLAIEYFDFLDLWRQIGLGAMDLKCPP
jgi:hypothetical protein